MIMDKELKARNIFTLGRLGIYLFAWLLLVIITGLIAADGLFIPIDQKVYSKYFNSEASQEEDRLLKKFVFIDIPVEYLDTILSKEQKRLQTVRLLNTIDSMVISNSSEGVYPSYYKKPTIILDISYSADMVAVSDLKTSLASHKNNNVKVYAAYPAPELDEIAFYKSYDAKFNADLYDNFFEGKRLHTETLKFADPCIRSYQSFIEIDIDADLDIDADYAYPIESLINRVAIDQKGLGEETDFSKVISKPINTFELKNKFGPRTYEFEKANNSIRMGPPTSDSDTEGGGYYDKFDKTLDLNGAFIIIGQFDDDLHTICEDKTVPGPYLVGSGIINKLIENKTIRESHDNIPVQLGMALLFSLLICVFFALIYKYFNSLKTKPLLIAFLTFVIGMLFLAGFGYALLQYTVIRPALPSVSMFWAAFLSWRFSNKFLVTGIVKGSDKYDIFISYSFGDSKWVKNTLYNSLKGLEKSDGSKLEIFLAEKSITVGELFVSKYMKAIVDSKLFIPVMSHEYYTKNHCINEMDLAVKRKIEDHINICILAFNPNHVPEQFSNLLFLDANNPSDFITNIENKIIEIDSKQTDIKDDNLQTNKGPEDTEKPSKTDIIPKGDNLGIDHENKLWIDSKELVKRGVESELLGKGIIIINNSSGELTLNASGVTLTVNDKKSKKEELKKAKKKLLKKDKKQHNKKDKKRSAKKVKKKAKKTLEKKVMKQVLKKIEKQLAKKSKKKKKN